MISRVTHATIQRSTHANLQHNLQRMADMQAKLSSGKTITKPSDDPGGLSRTLRLRADEKATQQYQRNADDGVAWMSTIDSALQTSVASLRRARDLTVQGANGSMSVQAREAIALEIEGIRDALLDQANTNYLGRSVFAGTSDAGRAFESGSYAWTGVPGASVERRIAAETTVRADADGAAIFGTGGYVDDPAVDPAGGSVFALLDRIAADLRSGEPVSDHLNKIDARQSAMLGALADVGTRYGQLEAAQQSTEKAMMDLTGQISAIEDIDLAETILQIQSQEVAYQAALGATARVLQPSLMDFLR